MYFDIFTISNFKFLLGTFLLIFLLLYLYIINIERPKQFFKEILFAVFLFLSPIFYREYQANIPHLKLIYIILFGSSTIIFALSRNGIFKINKSQIVEESPVITKEQNEKINTDSKSLLDVLLESFNTRK